MERDLERNRSTEKTGRRLTLAEYVRRRNGVPMGAAGSLRNMFRRSLGAGSFAGFWQYWNPIFGYYLGRYVYAPLQGPLPRGMALVATFGVCGAVHDLVTMAVRGSVTFLFTPWFLLHGVGVVAGRALGLDFSERPWAVRAAINLAYVSLCLAVTIAGRRILSIP